jgi:hypothetical protein
MSLITDILTKELSIVGKIIRFIAMTNTGQWGWQLGQEAALGQYFIETGKIPDVTIPYADRVITSKVSWRLIIFTFLLLIALVFVFKFVKLFKKEG